MRVAGFYLVLLLCGVGCAGSQPGSEGRGNRLYTFDHDGVAYEIYSLDMPTVAPVNLLIRREAGRIVLRARDDDQDGTLDTLLTGTLTLDAANVIYRAGIARAVARGRYDVRLPAEVYRTAVDGRDYAIQTYRPDPDRAVNVFVIYDSTFQEHAVLIDVEADGVLDTTRRGTVRPEEAQDAYEAVLRRGEAEGRLLRQESRIVVRPGAA